MKFLALICRLVFDLATIELVYSGGYFSSQLIKVGRKIIKTTIGAIIKNNCSKVIIPKIQQINAVSTTAIQYES